VDRALTITTMVVVVWLADGA